MKYDRVWRAFVFLGIVMAVTAGCSKRQAASPVDADKAREALKTTLSTWQKGESLDSLKQNASITASDAKWAGGHQLIRYEVTEDKVVGLDLQCHVLLVLKGPDGKQTEEKALFVVSTAPGLVVLHTEG
jgi:hypothetical protein